MDRSNSPAVASETETIDWSEAEEHYSFALRQSILCDTHRVGEEMSRAVDALTDQTADATH